MPSASSTAARARAATDTRVGMTYAVSAYALWGLLPVFWKLLGRVPALEILCHRMVWSLVFVGTLLAIRRDWRWLPVVALRPRTLLIFAGTGSILAVNWLTYIWGVNTGQIVETSLGYFINPLMYVLLGVVVLRERLRRAQAIAVALAGIGVLYLTIQHGSFPWIALTLATSFAVYGLVRKVVPLGALHGLTLETMALCLPAAAYLIHAGYRGEGAFGAGPPVTSLLLFLSGSVTALPLLLFTTGARRLPLVTVGILQYIAPTLQLLLGVFAYGERFGGARAVGFAFVWCALLIYTGDGMASTKRHAWDWRERNREAGLDI